MQQQTTPASAGVDFDDAKKTPRRLGLVFGVGYYRSGERHGERFEIDRGAQFPPIIFFGERITTMTSKRDFYTFRFRLLLFSTIERERRAEDHLLLQFYQKTTPHPRARAFERRRKKGEKKKKKKTTVWRTGFDLSFFLFRRRSWTSLFQ